MGRKCGKPSRLLDHWCQLEPDHDAKSCLMMAIPPLTADGVRHVIAGGAKGVLQIANALDVLPDDPELLALVGDLGVDASPTVADKAAAARAKALTVAQKAMMASADGGRVEARGQGMRTARALEKRGLLSYVCRTDDHAGCIYEVTQKGTRKWT